MAKLKGMAKVDRKTKDLIARLKPGDIAIIDHQNLDEVAARSLIERRVAAVINASKSIIGQYPNKGPLMLLEANIPLIDNCGSVVIDNVIDGDEVSVFNQLIYLNHKLIGVGELLIKDEVLNKMEESHQRLNVELQKFITNTLDYAQKEKDIIFDQLPISNIKPNIKGRQVLIVVRGKNYREDLKTIQPYLNENQPVIIAVDGGADALLLTGYKPDIILGDMDSVSDKALTSGAQLIVHAYPNGKAPGLERIEKLGLEAEVLPAPGTSEDVAMLLAYQFEAELIVALGTHSNMIDFLEKGRKGMASTLLVRMKVGPILVDAKGVSKLYKNRVKFKYVAEIVAAALIPFTIVSVASPYTYQFFRLLYMNLQVLFNY